MQARVGFTCWLDLMLVFVSTRLSYDTNFLVFQISNRNPISPLILTFRLTRLNVSAVKAADMLPTRPSSTP